jgi:hypothetical protein
MDIGAAYPSKWLKPHDLGDSDCHVTITAFDYEEKSGGGDFKDIQYFLTLKEFKDKKFGLNKTNAGTVGKLHGRETDNWIGKRITLYATEVEAFGEQTLGIRIRLRPPPEGAKPPANSNGTHEAAPTLPPDPMGDAGSNWLTKQIDLAIRDGGATPSDATVDKLRSHLLKVHPNYEGVIAGEPATWPKGFIGAIKSWLEGLAIPF